MGEKMKGAALNTIIGLVTVFLILILIAFLISRFVYISKLEEKFKERAKAKQEEKESPALDGISNVTAQIEAKESAELVDDTELVAVITAAICAATGTSSNGFVVRSIRKSKRR
jgi:sodium pump decarboxylase gamma subunit